MEFYRIWRILVGHRWLLIWLPIIAACVGLAMTYVLPQEYESTALVLVRPGQEIKFNPSGGNNSNEIVDFPVNLSAPIDAPSKTYIQVIKSHAVAERIVESLKLDVKKPKQYGNLLDAVGHDIRTWLGAEMRTLRNYLKYGRDIQVSPFDQAVEEVQKNLVVVPQQDTYVFDITYRSADPATAAAVANMAAEIFLQQSSTAYRSDAARARKFIETQLAQSRTALDQAREATLAYKRSHGTFDLKAEYDEKLRNLSDLENTLEKAEGKLAGIALTSLKGSAGLIGQQADIAELKRQIAMLRGQLTDYPKAQSYLDAITLNERLAQQSYEFFLKQDEEARVREAATIAEIRVVSHAVPSQYPVKPVKYLYAGLSFVTALVVAIGWALFTESLDPRVRTIGDLDGELGVVVLGAIPRLRRSRGPRLLSYRP